MRFVAADQGPLYNPRPPMRAALLFAATLLLAACTTAPAKPPMVHCGDILVSAPPPGVAACADKPAPSFGDDLVDAVLWFQNTVEHDQAYRTIFRAAERAIDTGLADNRWNALIPDEQAPGKVLRAPAVIVDVDETVLDDSAYQARLARDGREYADATWESYMETRSSHALAGAVAFAEHARERGVAVLYVSNRHPKLLAATIDNLKREHFPEPIDASTVLLPQGPGCEDAGLNKGCRRRQLATQYRVLALVGDQLVDFIDLPENTPAARAAAVAPYADRFGERWFMLPNPMYGSWAAAVSGDPKQPWAERHRKKVDALRKEDR